jgi:hypothetical protein
MCIHRLERWPITPPGRDEEEGRGEGRGKRGEGRGERREGRGKERITFVFDAIERGSGHDYETVYTRSKVFVYRS